MSTVTPEHRENICERLEFIFKKRSELGRRISKIEGEKFTIKKWTEKCTLVEMDRHLKAESNDLFKLI